MKKVSFILAFLCALMTCPAFSLADNTVSLLTSGQALVGTHSQATIPFELVGHLIIVKAGVDGSKADYTFVLDTGSITAVSKKFASRLGLQMEGSCSATGATGAGSKVCLTRLKNLSLGGLEAGDVSAVVFNPHFSQRAGIRIDGFIGSNFLRFFKVRIDYSNKLLTLSRDTAPLAPVAGATLVTIKEDWKNAFVPQVAIRCGNTGFAASIDTGLCDPMSLPAPFFDTTNIEAQLYGNGAMASGNFGNLDKARLVRLSDLSLGPLKIGKAVATTQPGQTYALIGYGLLSNFTVTIDYPSKQMLLVPNHGGRPIDNIYSTGLALGRDYAGKTVVTGVWKPSPAANMGLAPGDVITEIDGKPADSYTLAGVQKLLFDTTVPTLKLSVQEPLGDKNFTIDKRYLF
ncbi:MAG: aspartyl protease family protein [Syntrophobacteraceae bacterium]